MPPLQALAALHGFWIMMLMPPVWWLLRHSPPGALRRLGMALTALAILGHGMVVAHTLLVWLPEEPAGRSPYVGHRILFVLLTLSDIPLLQLTAAGVVCWLAGRHKKTVSSRQRQGLPPTGY